MKKKNENLIKGTLAKHRRGFGFVMHEGEEDIFIAADNMNGAMNGDIVLVDMLPEYLWGQSKEGIITRITDRHLKEVVGTFRKSKKFGFVVPDDKHLNDDVFIRKKDFSGAQQGDKVVAKITKYPDRDNSAEGKVTEVISRRGQPGGDIKALIRQYNMFQTFPSRASAEAKAVSSGGISKQDIEKRVDLRSKTIFTIDGADSKDFDDAVSIEMLDSGNYLLGVHIADVSHYVAEDGPLDREALKRGSSVYLINQVVPMLPESLSNGICSLNPHEDRLTLSVDIEITPDGIPVRHNIYESVIHSKARMVYTDVSDMLENKNAKLIKKYELIYEDLLLMEKLAEVLREKREERGSLDFDLNEANIVLDKSGIPVNIGIAERRLANKLIEEFMLLANETIAEHFFWLQLPFVYRVHEKPSPDKMEEFRTFMHGLGIAVKGSAGNMHPKTLSGILKQTEGQTYEKVVSSVMLRSMQKAVYNIECRGHFGLALKYYCHFTSPIRRYPDLIVHRIIKAYLNADMDKKRIKSFGKKTAEAAELSSTAERQAIELEREVEKLKKAEYMSHHVGEEFEGIISGVTNYGIYVELENTVEGMVRLEYLNDDYYDYEAAKYRVVGRRSHRVFALGDRLRVKVHSVNIENKEINFSCN